MLVGGRILRHLLRQRRRSPRRPRASLRAACAAARAASLLRLSVLKRMCDTSISSGTEYFVPPPRDRARGRGQCCARGCGRIRHAPRLRPFRSSAPRAGDPSRARSCVRPAGSRSMPCARARAASVLLTSRLLRTACTRCGLLANVSRLSGGMRSRSASQSPRVSTVSGALGEHDSRTRRGVGRRREDDGQRGARKRRHNVRNDRNGESSRSTIGSGEWVIGARGPGEVYGREYARAPTCVRGPFNIANVRSVVSTARRLTRPAYLDPHVAGVPGSGAGRVILQVATRDADVVPLSRNQRRVEIRDERPDVNWPPASEPVCVHGYGELKSHGVVEIDVLRVVESSGAGYGAIEMSPVDEKGAVACGVKAMTTMPLGPIGPCAVL